MRITDNVAATENSTSIDSGSNIDSSVLFIPKQKKPNKVKTAQSVFSVR
jgi:hypothetical protein